MPCNKTWEPANGKTMPMHSMSDQHVLNAYRRLEEIVDGAAEEAAGLGLEGDQYDTFEFTSSMCDLEVEAERRWGPGDGEAHIRERIEKGVNAVPLKPIRVGGKS